MEELMGRQTWRSYWCSRRKGEEGEELSKERGMHVVDEDKLRM